MAPPESVELLNDNKGIIINDSGEKLVDIPEHKILTFWDKIDELKIWKWKKEYSPKDEIEDGHQWELKLRNRNAINSLAFKNKKVVSPKFFN